MPQILPDTFLENTTHLYLPQVRARSMLLYGMVLLAVIGAAIAAFFVKIDVSFAAAGAVRSVAEKTEVRSLVSGRVVRNNAKENQAVRVGDTLPRWFAFATRTPEPSVYNAPKYQQLCPSNSSVTTGRPETCLNNTTHHDGAPVIVRAPSESEVRQGAIIAAL